MASHRASRQLYEVRFVELAWEPPPGRDWLEYTHDAESVAFWATRLSGNPECEKTDARPRLVRVAVGSVKF